MSGHAGQMPPKGTGAAAGLRAVILAGGKGTALRPFTVNFPKPLVPLGDMPVLEVLIRQLLTYEITDITLTLGHLAELVLAYFDHRKALGGKSICGTSLKIRQRVPRIAGPGTEP